MDKYIVEIDGKNICSDSDGKSKLALSVKSDNGYAVFCTEIPLTPYTDPDLEQVRKEAYDKGYDDATAEIGSDEQAIADKAYQKGLSDAWEAARKIQDTGGNLNWWIHNTSASEAAEKIRQYEQEKKEILVGDEVTPRETEYDDMIVTRLWKDDYDSDCIDAIGFDGRIGSFLVSRVSKTGKHYEIAEVLAKMKETDNG